MLPMEAGARRAASEVKRRPSDDAGGGSDHLALVSISPSNHHLDPNSFLLMTLPLTIILLLTWHDYRPALVLASPIRCAKWDQKSCCECIDSFCVLV